MIYALYPVEEIHKNITQYKALFPCYVNCKYKSNQYYFVKEMQFAEGSNMLGEYREMKTLHITKAVLTTGPVNTHIDRFFANPVCGTLCFCLPKSLC